MIKKEFIEPKICFSFYDLRSKVILISAATDFGTERSYDDDWIAFD